MVMKLVRDPINSSIIILGDDNRILQVVKESEILDAAAFLREEKYQKYRKRASKMNNTELLRNYTEMVGVTALNQESNYPDFELIMDTITTELFKRLSI